MALDDVFFKWAARNLRPVDIMNMIVGATDRWDLYRRMKAIEGIKHSLFENQEYWPKETRGYDWQQVLEVNKTTYFTLPGDGPMFDPNHEYRARFRQTIDANIVAGEITTAVRNLRAFLQSYPGDEWAEAELRRLGGRG